jgi:hypothetical protein
MNARITTILAVFFICGSSWAKPNLAARAHQLGDLLDAVMQTDNGAIETPKISKFKGFYKDFVSSEVSSNKDDLSAAATDSGFGEVTGHGPSLNDQEIYEEDIPRIQALGYLKILTQIYFADLVESTVILEDGVYDGPESAILPPGRVFVDDSATQALKRNKLNAIEALHFIKDNFKEFYLQVLGDSSFPVSMITSKDTVKSTGDFVVYSYESIAAGECVTQPTRAIEVLEQFELLPGEISYCSSEVSKGNLLDCFQAHDGFLEYLKQTKFKQVYVFLEGGKTSGQPTPEKAGRKYCQFLGGNWWLDRKNPGQMDPRSHVNFLTSEGERKTISADELSKMRLELIKTP